MVNILIIGHSEFEKSQLERCISKAYPDARIYYADNKEWIAACFKKYVLDVIIIPATGWDRCLFDLPPKCKLPLLILTTSAAMRGTEVLETGGLSLLRQPFTEWQVFTLVNRDITRPDARAAHWDFLIFRYNCRFVVLPFRDIRSIEYEPPYLTIRSKASVFVMVKNLCDVLAKIPTEGEYPVLVGRPQTDTGKN